ncbi:MAG TPA: DUF4271 domain-containing protein [Cyclobacteriaceae bacterium]|nr:DUF4271 domain-containing protein [Cyclobacteriaceae bacterium]
MQKNFRAHRVRRLLIVIIFFSTVVGFSQPLIEHPVVTDLQKDWKVFSEGQFESYEPHFYTKDRTIYFEVDPGRYSRGSYLEINGARPFSVYINYQQIAFERKFISLNLDSLRTKIPEPWLLSVYHSKGLSWLQTKVVSPSVLRSDIGNSLRAPEFYLDFSIIVSVLLLIYFTVLLRTNPRLTLDYLNFIRLFSIQEREDTLLNSRISASVNILYYLFSSLVAGFSLLTIFHFGANLIPISESFAANSFGQSFLQWFKISGMIFIVLLAKLILLLSLARLFDFRDAPSPQFYNYVRLMFFISILSGLVCICYFVFKIQSPEAYSFLIGAIVLLLIVWVVVIGLKLMRRSTFRFFHLFSYLCASELIPIVILVKVLNS